MNQKVYKFNASIRVDDDEQTGQTLFDENGNCVFCVYNLNECPEDAIIRRGLFDANDYINAVKYGIQLAQQGYTDVEIGEVKTVSSEEF